ELGRNNIRRNELDLRRPGGHHVPSVKTDDRAMTEQIAEQGARPLRVSCRENDTSDRAGTVWMLLPFRPPYEVGGLMLAEINATHPDPVRIEPGSPKLRIARYAIEGDRAGERRHRQDREARCRGLAMDQIGISSLEHQTVEADRKGHELRAGRAVLAKAEQLEVVRRKHREMVERAQGVMSARRQVETERGKA